MANKFDKLREGKAIEWTPGVFAQLDKEKKTLQLSTGEILDASRNRDLFPSNEQDLAIARHKEDLEKKIKGPGTEFLYQYTSQGIPGGLSDWGDWLTRSPEDYTSRKAAEAEVSGRISKKSPYLSAAATGANVLTDLALTRGMSAAKAAPLLTLGSAGSRVVTDPAGVATETALSAAGGYGIDKTMGYLGKVASRRAQSRALPAQQQAVRESNRLGQAAVDEANALQTQQYNALKENVKGTNASRVRDYEKELVERQNEIIRRTDAFKKQQAEREADVLQKKHRADLAKAQDRADAEIAEREYQQSLERSKAEAKRFDDEYKLQQKQYEQLLKDMPNLQKKAQKEFSDNVIRNANQVERAFPKDSRISTKDLGVSDFIEEVIDTSGLAASREGNQAKKVLQALFPEGEVLTSSQLAKRYKAIEDSIQRSSPEVQEVLSQFKEFAGNRIPRILSNNIAYSRVMPTLTRQVEKEVGRFIESFKAPSNMGNVSNITSSVKDNAKNIFSSITPEQFIERLQSGELKRHILDSIINPTMFLPKASPNAKLNKLASVKYSDLKDMGYFKAYESLAEEMKGALSSKLDKAFSNAKMKILGVDYDSSRKLGAKVKKTYGVSDPVPPPEAPIPPQAPPFPERPNPPIPRQPEPLPPPIAPPETPQMPAKPALLNEPSRPTPQSFNPQEEPILSSPQGLADRMGDFFERGLGGGTGIVNNPLTKLAGLKYVLGKGALPVEAAYMGMNALTSPSALGEAARLTFQRGGIKAIEEWARSYPSYREGILDSPQDRRALSKQIEDDPSIPIEKKAIYQSKVNRGVPLEAPLH